MTESKEEEESSELSKTSEEEADEEEERVHRNACETWNETSETAITTTVTDLTVPFPRLLLLSKKTTQNKNPVNQVFLDEQNMFTLSF